MLSSKVQARFESLRSVILKSKLKLLASNFYSNLRSFLLWNSSVFESTGFTFLAWFFSMTFSQFYQLFTSSFIIFCQKNYRVKLYLEKSCAKHVRTKTLLVKCLWNWYLGQRWGWGSFTTEGKKVDQSILLPIAQL